MNSEIRKKYIKAGKIASQVKDKARKIVQPGERIFNIAELLEAFIIEKGGKIAFPINISINEIAAHYTPTKSDLQEIKEDDVVKIDIGVHIDGYIADTAVTINPSQKYRNLINSVEKALEEAIKIVKAGLEIKEIGRKIQETIEKTGYKPIRNLGGHYMERYVQHTGTFIPNVKTNTQKTLQVGDVIAIEPFATTGSGKVKEGKEGNIYKFKGGKTRGRMERELLKIILKEYRTLPFTSRWFKDFSDAKTNLAISKLLRQNIIQSYPILKEANEGIVAQAEHTILIEEKPIVTTF